MAANLGDEEIAAVAAYYAAMSVPAPAAQSPAEDAVKIAVHLVEWGDWKGRGLPGCAECHGPAGNGIGSSFPGIAGRHAGYIKAQLQAWKGGTRSNDPFGEVVVRGVVSNSYPKKRRLLLRPGGCHTGFLRDATAKGFGDVNQGAHRNA